MADQKITEKANRIEDLIALEAFILRATRNETTEHTYVFSLPHYALVTELDFVRFHDGARSYWTTLLPEALEDLVADGDLVKSDYHGVPLWSLADR